MQNFSFQNVPLPFASFAVKVQDTRSRRPLVVSIDVFDHPPRRLVARYSIARDRKATPFRFQRVTVAGEKNVNKVGRRASKAIRLADSSWSEGTCGGGGERRGPGVRVGNKSCPFSSGSKKGYRVRTLDAMFVDKTKTDRNGSSLARANSCRPVPASDKRPPTITINSLCPPVR